MTFLGADSRILYTLLIAGVAAQRLVELRLARRHQTSSGQATRKAPCKSTIAR